MLPSGDLYVLNASPSDGYRSYRCRTLHRLTGSTQESSTAGKIVVTEPKGPVPPRLNEKSSAVIGRRGQDAVIPCTAQGHPTPSYWASTITSVGEARRDMVGFMMVGMAAGGEEKLRGVGRLTVGLGRDVRCGCDIVAWALNPARRLT
ncbi:hypothetical protein J437_LFUL011492 [Ladona fulva]|uniref:Uncharacterized protein n=1 Tax=Ladona fulva TaxID=123851 RepID=A0A8K0K9Z3_LADFU|nr:hypothetical protein J437_LFUL011492 [Ladona fulva]